MRQRAGRIAALLLRVGHDETNQRRSVDPISPQEPADLESLSAFATRSASTLFEDPAHLKTYAGQLERELSRLREAISPFGPVQIDAQWGSYPCRY